MTNDTTLQATIQALQDFNQDSERKFSRQYRDAIADLTSGKKFTPENLNRILESAGKSFSDFQADISRAELIKAVVDAKTEAADIESQCKPLAAEWRKAKADFDALASEYREKSQRLEMQIQSLRMPLRDHDALRQRLQTAEQEMPDSIRSVVRGWEREKEGLQSALKAASRETFEPNNVHGAPASPERIAQFQRDESKRLAEVRRLETRINILLRAQQLVRETALCVVTGLFDPHADVASCLNQAQQEADAASIEDVQIEETADQANEESE